MQEYDTGNGINETSPRSGERVQPYFVTWHNRRAAVFAYAKRILSAPLNPQRLLQRLALLAAIVLCVGQSFADAHLHFDAQEEQACTLCAISEPGHVPEIGWVDAQPPVRCRTHAVRVFSTTIAPRSFEARPSRAPPVS